MNFVIAGAFSHFSDLSKYILKNKPQNKYNIVVYDGINLCKWNAGRINRNITYEEYQIHFYYSKNIGIALTFSNPVIDLNDEVGLQLLEKFHKHGNYIILVNEKLRKFIRKFYPKYKLIFSITGLGNVNIPMQKSDLVMYQMLEEKYDYIVPRMEHVFDPMFLQLDQSKYEIMLNDTCIKDCPYYSDHFKSIAQANTAYENPWEDLPFDICFGIEECWLDFDPSVNKCGKDGMDITIPQINELLQRGIKSFKIMGRELSNNEFQNEIHKYLGVEYIE